MDQTLGKRISANRKRLGLTQDQLAEQLGVTAQAVSKWENDQSCPDIATLPRLAEIFGITTDELLGRESAQKIHEAEVVTQEEQDGCENNGIHLQKAGWEFRWDAGKKNAVGFGLWILTVGILYFCSKWFRWDASLWDILWPSALTYFGLFGLYPKFSFFRLGCTVFGAYFLVDKLVPMELPIGGELIIPVILILWGLSLVADALRKNKKSGAHLYYNGKQVYSKEKGKPSTKGGGSFSTGEDSFVCSGSFCDEHYSIALAQLVEGTAEVSFGELSVDLSEVESVSDSSTINANCSFGELILKIPRRFRVNMNKSGAFSQLSQHGEPDDNPKGIINLNADVSFGEITVEYI